MTVPATTLILTPAGHLLLTPAQDETPGLPEELQHRLEQAFHQSTGQGLVELGLREVGTVLPPNFAFWRDLAARYIIALCMTPDTAAVPAPSQEDLDNLVATAPPMPGGEYLNAAVLESLWNHADTACRESRAKSKQSLYDYLKAHNPAWNLVGRVHFNLAENRGDAEAPFAFIATYTTQLSAQGRAQHLPLAEALREYSGAKSKARLLSLLRPVQQAATQLAWVRAMVEADEIYHPLRWTAAEALQFLRDVPTLESAGIIVRCPGSWRSGRPSRPQVKAIVGGRPPSVLGQDALLDFNIELTLGDERLTAAEIRSLLAGSDGLQFLHGRWVEIDRDKLSRLLERFRQIEKTAAESGLPFGEAMRLMAGVALESDTMAPTDRDWSTVVAGPWLSETLQGLRTPEGLAHIDPGVDLKATLRPYQHAGVRWLYLLNQLGLGACLADDMGLGKTIQVLALLLILKRQRGPTQKSHRPSILVAPASLMANWAAEIERFAPSLSILLAHPSAMDTTDLKAVDAQLLGQVDLVITSYGALLRYPWLMDTPWQIAILDEAQAIKNPGSKQTAAVKKLAALTRIALTGTPVENRLSDLWSIFDFTHNGLLGSGKAFSAYVKRLSKTGSFAPLRNLVRPYILRRLKTDKAVIADLPDKTEVKAFCYLSPTQAALYQKAVQELAKALDTSEGIQRKGIVLSFLMRFKQICNHPSQWLGDEAWKEGDSGKLVRLRELAEVIAAKQEKLLVFTQFRETTQPLANFLGHLFGREGLVLHGGTPVAQRKTLVRRFQE
ncbi:MAG TPA: DEAD/DEAH box helicase, partial [Steroidobacteraceae bacterium]